MGKRGYPAISMTQHAARTFCKWLSAKTGRYYRLPTEAEWEYACRAGTTTRYSWGDDASKIDDYAWYYENSNDKYQKVGKKLPNPWGLFDMHGNVAEWVLDQHDTEFMVRRSLGTQSVNVPLKLYPRVVRGSSWQDDRNYYVVRLGSDRPKTGSTRIRRNRRVLVSHRRSSCWVTDSTTSNLQVKKLWKQSGIRHFHFSLTKTTLKNDDLFGGVGLWYSSLVWLRIQACNY